MQEENINEERKEIFNPSPKSLYEYLNQYVIGQDEAKKTLSVAIYNHYKRVMLNNGQPLPPQFDGKGLDDVVIDKSNVILMGQSGSGKTYMVKKLCEVLNLPCYIADSTKFTQSGYVGDDVESVLLGLIKAANGNIKAAECGVCITDEIDKIARKGENVSITRDVGGEGVQQSLLKIVEGSKVGVPPNGGRKHPEQELVYMDTTNILFIGMGAFDGLEKIIERRTNRKTIGFNSVSEQEKENEDLLSQVMSEDLIKFGFIPELIGRFPVLTHTNALSKEDLVRIIKEPKNSILKQYQKLMLVDGVTLNFTDDAIDEIAGMALTYKTGARALRRIMEKVLNDIMFEYACGDESEITIDKEYVKEKYGKLTKSAA